MKRNFILGLIAISGLPLLNSCKDDPKPVAAISFETTDQEVSESDGTIASFNPLLISSATGQDVSVKVSLDKPAPDNIVISYSVSGTASRTITTANNSTSYNDFNLNGTNATTSETLVIEKGASDATITLNVYEDYEFEVDDNDNMYETVILTLDKVVSGPGNIATTGNNVYTLKINEDDALVFLQWDQQATDVDMDIFAFLGGDLINYANNKDNDYENLIIPAGFPDGSYDMSYTYYSGTSNSLAFTAYLFGRSLNNKSYLYPGDDPLPFSGTYTQQNVNPYPMDTDLPQVQIEQHIVKNKLNFTPSALSIPATGSRMAAPGMQGMKFSLKQLLRNNKTRIMALPKSN